MFTNQQHRQTLSFGTESKLFPKFILETSLEGSPENFRITLPAKPGLNNIINLTYPFGQRHPSGIFFSVFQQTAAVRGACWQGNPTIW